MTKQYDIIIIGAGPGGYVCAIKAAQLGLKTALIEKEAIGGTCLHRGCVPTKTLMHAARLYEEMKSCAENGILAENIHFDTLKMNAHKEAVTTQLVEGIAQLLKANGVDIICATASIVAAGIIKANDEEIRTRAIVIATGSSPAIPNIDGADLPNVLTSEEMLKSSNSYFKRLLIIGGGVIGVEMASLYSALDCEVTILEYTERLLPTMDREFAQSLSASLKKRGVNIYTKAEAMRIAHQDAQLVCFYRHKEEEEALPVDGIILAAGRTANLTGLFPETLNPKIENGRLVTNDRQETSIPGIYAIGDICAKSLQLAHLASAQGINAACAAAGVSNEINTDFVPSCLYTDPEIASVGLTEEEAKRLDIPIKVGKTIMSANTKTTIETKERGFIKILAHAESDKILGAQLMCRRATDMINEITMAISAGLTWNDLRRIIRPHPTFSEAIGEALDNIDGNAIHTMPKRKR